MSRTRKAGALLALVAGAVALTAIPAGAAKPGQTVNVPTTLKISVYGYKGKVTSGNSNCLAERTVVLKQKGQGVLGRDKSEDTAAGKSAPKTSTSRARCPTSSTPK